ncbi:MAG: hypothetical protein LBF77_05650, partial [Spirochaetaceae bacterium]|nr:hypothetical protein [Spirochaetaceae bacterium]
IAESAGCGRPAKETADCVKAVLSGAERFETPGLFQRFLSHLLDLVLRGMRGNTVPPGNSPQITAGISDEETIMAAGGLAGIFRELAAEAASAVGTYNLGPELVLEKMCVDFTRRILEIGSS